MRVYLVIIAVLYPLFSWAQSPQLLTSDNRRELNLSFSGYARTFFFYRNLDSFYELGPREGISLPRNLTLGDGYEEPLLLLRLQAAPIQDVNMQLEYFFDNRILREVTSNNRTDSLGRAFKIYRLFNFTGEVKKSFGTFKLTAGGGMNWLKMSPMTLWSYQYRDDLFDRYPWEPQGTDWNRYSSAFATGDIPRDQRWGNRGTQGFILEAKDLPYGFSGNILYGKTENSGGFLSFQSRVPRNVLGIGLAKQVGAAKFGLNYIEEFGYNGTRIEYLPVEVTTGNTTLTYQLENNYISQQVITTDFDWAKGNTQVYAELGVGSYLSNTYNEGLPSQLLDGSAELNKGHRFKRSYDLGMLVELRTQDSLKTRTFNATLYNIGTHFLNSTSLVFNTSIEEFKAGPEVPDANNSNYTQGLMPEVDQLANNRIGAFFQANKRSDKFSLKLGYHIAQEKENLFEDNRNGVRRGITNGITFLHRVNGLARSRFGFFERFLGPYDRIHHAFRRTFEQIGITDQTVDYKISYNTLDFSLQYKAKISKTEIILANYTLLSSSQDKLAVIPLTNDNAFLRQTYNESLVFWRLTTKTVLLGFYSFELNKGNQRTELVDGNGDLITNAQGTPVFDDTGKPLDQRGYGYGFGLDYQLSENAAINWRNRWYKHRDLNFVRDQFKGYESTLELKFFF